MVHSVTENSIPKKVFTLAETNPGDKIYEVCVTLRNVCKAVAATVKAFSGAKADVDASALFILEGLSGNLTLGKRFLCRFSSGVIGKPMDAVELKYATMGDAICEFEIESET
ncbi:MAG: hypothetical protein OEY22_07940 [Candidatus Bathyarchaeota archaeon]|nr:hypothetical protein [Candidatus Bathyarchaeota archaeon]MDH5787929.1 hypothetical protein [Candidatus Bathyarchaeota archaeon]